MSHTDRLKFADFLRSAEATSLRAGCRQVIEVLAIVIESVFKADNGESAVWRAMSHTLTSHMTSHIMNGLRTLRGVGMGSWQVQDAKARFSEFLDATIKKGPQVVTRRGIETAVLVPIEEWNRLRRAARPSLKTLLLAQDARCENLIPERHRLRRRSTLELK